MKGAIVHAVLLVAMLLFAYQTWTRDTSAKQTTGKVVLWNEKSGDLMAIVHETGDRTVKIERKGEGTSAYFWGTDTKVTKKPKKKEPPPPLADGGVPPVPPPDPNETPEMETTTTVREFPVGEAVAPLVTGYSAMRAISDLGVLTDEQKVEYELAESEKTISVVFASGSRSLVLGDKVIGGKDRYALEVDSGRGYVIAGALIEPLEGGERGLTPKSVIPTGDDVATIEITAGDKSKKVSRITVTDEAGKQMKTWGEGQKADQTTANFLEKIETQLKPSKYDATLDPATMTKLVTVTYRDAKGSVLGTLDVFKQAGEPGDYFVVSERTRVPGQVSKTAGDQVEQNIATVFQ